MKYFHEIYSLRLSYIGSIFKIYEFLLNIVISCLITLAMVVSGYFCFWFQALLISPQTRFEFPLRSCSSQAWSPTRDGAQIESAVRILSWRYYALALRTYQLSYQFNLEFLRLFSCHLHLHSKKLSCLPLRSTYYWSFH